MNTTVASRRSAHPLFGASRLMAGLSALTTHAEGFLQHRRECRELLSLDDRMLRDIGLSRADAERIASQPYIGAPRILRRL